MQSIIFTQTSHHMGIGEYTNNSKEMVAIRIFLLMPLNHFFMLFLID